MARTTSYPTDFTADGDDKVFGTNAEGDVTKNLTVEAIAQYVNSGRGAEYPIVSEDGTQFIIAVGNDGTLQAIPPNSYAASITGVPTVAGLLNVGETLTVTPAATDGLPSPTTVFRWQRSLDGLTDWTNIDGATGTTYLLGSLDENRYVRASQTTSNILGGQTVNSAPTTQIGQSLFYGILDAYPGAAAAFSLRRLTRFYEGPLVRVRRTLDNASTDIGYNVLGDLDSAALTSFCNPGGVPTDAKVEIWYNQASIGDDAIQSVDTKQLTIVENGNIVELNGKPTMYPPVGNIQSQNILPFNIIYSGSPNLSAFLVSQTSTDNTWNLVADNNISVPDGIIAWTSNGGLSAYRSGGGTTGDTELQHISTSLFNSSGYTGYRDGYLKRTDTASNMNDDWNFNFINIYGGTTGSRDRIQEVILYTEAKHSEREAIENIINEYYQVY